MKYILKAPIICYVSVIFIFSVVYVLSSHNFPDSFIIHKKLNEHPISEIKKVIWDSHKKKVREKLLRRLKAF